jgi:hypothetical protein
LEAFGRDSLTEINSKKNDLRMLLGKAWVLEKEENI